MELTPNPDVFDPHDFDWADASDTVVVSGAAAGIPQAVDELDRRNRLAEIGDTPTETP